MRRFSLVTICGVILLHFAGHGRTAGLIGSSSNVVAGAIIDLPVQGTMDWVHWGFDPTNLLNRATVSLPRISDVTALGTNGVVISTGQLSFSWTNGMPTPNAMTSNALSLVGVGSAFEITAAADTTVKRLQVYVSAVNAETLIEATLSDNSAPAFADTALSSVGPTNRVCTFSYSAATNQQTLRFRVTLTNALDADASIAIAAATLVRVGTNQPPSVAILSPANEANITTGSDVVINANAADADGAVTRVEFFDGATKLGETTNAPFSLLWTNPALGTHTLTAKARDDQGTNTTSLATTVFIVGTGGMLSAQLNSPTGVVNLTLEGAADWVHWGLFTETSVDRKAGVTPRINNFSYVGSGPAYQFADNFNGYTWTDGTPTLGKTNTTTGVYVFGVNNGFEIQAPADTSLRTLRVHVGVYGGRGRFRAYVSDYSAPVYTDTAVFNSGNGPGGIYSISYHAASAGQTVIVRFTLASRVQPDGNVTLQAASLVAENNPPTVSLTMPGDGSAIRFGSNIVFAADAADPDGTVSRVEFLDTNTVVAVSSNSPFTAIWTNAPLGLHALRARAVDDLGLSAVSEPSLISVVVPGGFLRGALATNVATTTNLSIDGALDWAHWGLLSKDSLDHRAGVPQQLSDVVLIGSNPAQRYANNFTGFTWTNGTPTSAATASRTGIFVDGLTNGFQMTVPANTQTKRLKVFAGLYGSRGHFEAFLSDFSAPVYRDRSLARVFQNASAVFTLDFAAATNNATLTVRYVSETLFDATYGNVTWQAATLSSFSQPVLTLQRDLTPGSGLNGIFFAAPNMLYAIESANDLSANSWQPLTNLTGWGTNAVFHDDSSGGTARFYRVRVE